MGANMARRLKDCGYTVTAVYDVYTEAAANLATELGCKHCTKLADVTADNNKMFNVGGWMHQGGVIVLTIKVLP